MDFLAGKKTYIVAAAAAVVTFLQMTGMLDQVMAETIYGFLGATGLATLRMGVGGE
jgi:hypothetical protein